MGESVAVLYPVEKSAAPRRVAALPLAPAAAPAVERRVLPNGLTLLIQEDRSSALAAFHAVVRTGSATEGEYLGSGVSHVVEHMLFKGTHRRPVGQIEREARSYGGTSQGFTTTDSTRYQMTVNAPFWSQAADLLMDALFFPSMDAGEFVKEREVVLRELRLRRDDPAQIAWDLLFSNAYRIHPYRVPIIGTEAPLAALTPEDARRYHALHYVPNRVVVSVVGAVDRSAVVRRFEELTAKIPAGRVSALALPEEPLPLGAREIAQEADVQLGTVAVGFPGIAVDHPDLYALDLLAWILGGGRGSRLERALQETGLVHSVGAWNYTPMQRGLFVVSMRADAGKVEEAIPRLFKELAGTREGLLSESELQAARKAFLREYVQERQTVSGRASDLAGYEALVGDPLFAHRYLAEVSRLRPEDLKRVARIYLQPDRATTVRLLPRGVPKEGPAVVERPAPELKTEKVVLPNGLRLLLQPDPRLPLVTFHVAMLGGVRFEAPEKSGLSLLTARMLLRGTQRRSAAELTEELRRMGAEIGPFSGRNSLGFTLQAMTSEAEGAARLAAELVEEPSFPAEELEKERRLGLAGLKAQEEDPFGWGLRRLVSTLFRRHPYQLDPSGREAAWRGFSRGDVESFYRQVADSERLVVTIVGDFEPEKIRGILEDALGPWRPAATAAPEVPMEPPLTSRSEHWETTPRQEAMVLIGFPGIRLEDPRLAAVDLAEGILAGGAGRLFAEVRDKRGLAYTVGAFAFHGVDPGCFALYAVADPARLEEVQRVLLAEADRLRSEPMPAQELEEVKQGLLGARRIARQSQANRAAQMGSDELYGLGWDFSQIYEAKVATVTPQEFQAAVRDLLDPARCAIVIGKPGEGASSAQGSGSICRHFEAKPRNLSLKTRFLLPSVVEMTHYPAQRPALEEAPPRASAQAPLEEENTPHLDPLPLPGGEEG